MADSIPNCPAFQAHCCVLHHIQSTLTAQRSHIESICTRSSAEVVDSNLSQLNTTLSQGTAFYTCKSHEDPQAQNMGLADRKTYIWWVLKKYDDIMQFTGNLYSEAAGGYTRMK